jgi:RNA polymerase sigma-70 factor (family 1)
MVKIIYAKLSDAELNFLLKNGDRSAYTEIFNRYNKFLYSHAYNKLRDSEDAMDIVQEVFIKLWEKPPQLDDLNLPAYLVTMVRNRILNLISHQKIVNDYTLSLKDYMNNINETDHLIREKQLSEIIEEEIASLPTKMRQVFELSRKEHLSNKEIAHKLGLSEHTVADQIKKSLKTLRIKLGLAILMIYLTKP